MRTKWRTGGSNEPMTMQQPPPMPVRQFNAQDESHLKLIAVLHYVMGGLYLLGIGFLAIHFAIMAMVVRHAESENAAPVPVMTTAPGTAGEAAPPAPSPTAMPATAPFPKQIIPFLIAFYVIIGLFLVTLCVCNIFSGRYIRKRKNRTFSFVVAGVNCLQFPFGTALGVFTFIVLSRLSVKLDYDSRSIPE